MSFAEDFLMNLKRGKIDNSGKQGFLPDEGGNLWFFNDKNSLSDKTPLFSNKTIDKFIEIVRRDEK